MSDSDLQVRLSSSFDPSGTNAAKAALDEVKRLETTSSSQSVMDRLTNTKRQAEDFKDLAQSTSDYSQGLPKMASAAADTRKEMEQAVRAAFSMRMAAMGASEGFRGMAHAAFAFGESIGGAITKVSVLGAALAAGFKVGTMIGEWVNELRGVNNVLDACKLQADAMEQSIKDVRDARLDNFNAQLKSMTDGFSKAVERAERLQHLIDMTDDAQLAANISVLNQKMQSGEITKEQRDWMETDLRNASRRRKLEREQEAIDTQAKMDESYQRKYDTKLGTLTNQRQDASDLVKALQSKAVLSGLIDPAVFDLSPQNREEQIYKAITKGESSSYRDRMNPWKKDGLDALRRLLPAYGIEQDKKQEEVTFINENKPALQEIENRKQERPFQIESLKSKYQEQGAAEAAAKLEKQNYIDAEMDKWMTALNKERETPQDVSNAAATRLKNSLFLTPSVRRDNTGQLASQSAQKADETSRLAQAQQAIQTAQARAGSGVDPSLVMDQLIQTLQTLNVRLVGEVDTMGKLQATIKDMGATVSKLGQDVGDMKMREKSAGGLD